MNNLIEILQHKDWLWQGGVVQSNTSRLSSGYQEMDDMLDGGFPEQGVIEVLSEVGIGELRLVLPSIIQGQDSSRDKLWVLINPPGQLNGEMLLAAGIKLSQVIVVHTYDQTQGLWSAEQCLKSGACHAVMQWAHETLAPHHIKRLQIASEKGDCRQFIFRQQKKDGLPLPVDLSISLKAHENGVEAKIDKRKRGWPSTPFMVNMAPYWPALVMPERANNVISFPGRKTAS